MSIGNSCATITGILDSSPEEKPLVLLLIVPVSMSELLSFDNLPEPELSVITSPVHYDPPVYTNKLVDPEPIEAATFIMFAALPEPVVPLPENPGRTADGIDAALQTFVVAADEGGTPTAREPATTAVYATHSVAPEPALPEVAPVTPATGVAAVDTRAVYKKTAGDPPPAAVAPPQPAETEPTEVITSVVAGPAAAPEPDSGFIQTGERHSYAREIFAMVKDKVPLSFEGRGWIFTGAGINTSGITLNSRRITANETVFEFDASASGDYVLNFQFQDNFSGSMVSESVALRIKEPQGGAQQPAILHSAAQDSILPAVAPKDLTAALENPMAAVSSLPEILSSLGEGDEEGLDRIAKWYSEAGYIPEYRDCLEKYLEIFPGRRGNDRRYFELGKMYETVDFRNEKKARQYYAIIIDHYPASLYYGEAAVRVRYLDRHFLELR